LTILVSPWCEITASQGTTVTYADLDFGALEYWGIIFMNLHYTLAFYRDVILIMAACPVSMRRWRSPIPHSDEIDIRHLQSIHSFLSIRPVHSLLQPWLSNLVSFLLASAAETKASNPDPITPTDNLVAER
jgi:hypothetical protein